MVFVKLRSGKTFRTKGKKRSNRKRRTNITRIHRGNVIADKTIVSLPYVDIQNIGIAPGGGGSLNMYGQKTYCINSIYDPEPLAPNTSVLGWSEWLQFYTKYRVFACSYEITLYNASDDTAVSGSLYFAPASITGGPPAPLVGDPSNWLTQPRSRKFFLGNRSGGKSTMTLKGKVTLPGIMGMTAEQYRTAKETGSTYSGYPDKLAYMFINLLNTNPGINASQVQMSCKLTFHTELYERTVLDIPNTVPMGQGIEDPVE